MAGQIVFGILVGVLAIYGLCELLMKLRARVWMPCPLDVRVLILLKGRRRDLPELLSPMTRRMWRQHGVTDVAFLDAGLDAECRQEAERLSAQSGNSAVLDAAKWQEALKFELKESILNLS